MPIHAHLRDIVDGNTDFRRVLYTGKKMQLVAMTIPAGEEIGTETHGHVEQLLVIQSGSARATLNGKSMDLAEGASIDVPPGTEHNFVNIGDTPLKIFTVYAPPNHIDGRVHRTKAEADADQEDEDFGHAQR